MATAVTEKFVPWQGRVLREAGLRNPEEENPKYSCELSARDAEVLDTANSLGESLR